MELRDYIIALLIMCIINIAIVLILDSCDVNLSVSGWRTFYNSMVNGLIVLAVYSKIKNK